MSPPTLFHEARPELRRVLPSLDVGDLDPSFSSELELGTEGCDDESERWSCSSPAPLGWNRVPEFVEVSRA